MATNYPGAIDSLTNPSSGDALTSPSHSAQHANANDAIEAIETELGTDPAGASATVKARFEAIEANDWVTAARIAADAVGTSEIAANAVGSSELADNAVDTAAIATGAVTAAKFAVQPGNLLTDNQASVETDTTGWEADGATSLTRSTVASRVGSASLLVVSPTNDGYGAALTLAASPSVTPGETYTAVASVLTATGTRRQRLAIHWYTSGNAYISSASVTTSANPTSWTALSVTAVAPANAAKARLLVNPYGSGSAGDSAYWDALGLWKGSGGQWAMPGEPIRGLTDAPLGNLLSLNQASIETDTTGWVADGATAVARSTAEAYQGTGSLLVTSPADAYGVIALARIPVTAGEMYTLTAACKSASRKQKVQIYWYTAAGVYISGPQASTTSVPSSWTRIDLTETAPATAAFAAVTLRPADSGSAGDTAYWDAVSFHRGAGGVWQAPGVPVPGQSRIATNNAVDLSGTGTPEGVVTAAPGSTWLQTDATTDVKGWIRWVKATGTGNTGWQVDAEYDSGSRNLAAESMSNSWAVSGALFTLQRVGRTVSIDAAFTKASASADAAYTLPAGFRPQQATVRRISNTDTADDFVTVSITSAGVISIVRSSMSSDIVYASLSFLCATAAPSSLPGSAA